MSPCGYNSVCSSVVTNNGMMASVDESGYQLGVHYDCSPCDVGYQAVNDTCIGELHFIYDADFVS